VESVADGVPLFVEEIVKALEAARDADGPAPRRPESIVPPTLQGLLAERLDRLPGLAGMIDLAAVLGREFDRGLLQALSPPDGPSFRSAIARLVAQDVLRPVEGSRSRLEFKHTLLQEAAYERILRPRRRILHARVAELLAERWLSTAEAEPERIAHHWSCAGEPAKALAYWQLAGTRALRRAAFLEAAEHFRRGVESLNAARPGADGDVERADMLTHLAAAVQAGQTPAAEVKGIYETARSAYEGAERQVALVPVIRGQWVFHLLRAEYMPALKAAEEMLMLGSGGRRSECVADGHLYRGLATMYMGDLEVARAELEEAFERHRPPTRRDDIAGTQEDTGVAALAYLAIVLWNQGETQEALKKSDLSLEVAEAVGGPVTLAQAWGMRSGLHLARGELTQFRHWLEKTRVHTVERNIGYWRAVCSLWSAWLQGHAGQRELGIALLREHLDGYLGSASRLGVPHFQMLLADLHLADGEGGRAMQALDSAQTHIGATGERYYEPEVQWFMGRALMAGDNPQPAAASAAYERAMDAARNQDAKLLELRAATGLALHQQATGQASTALSRMRALCAWFGPDADVADVGRASALMQAGGASQRPDS
jgi:tetratricopeptide (TPR) repeat protein